MSVFAALLRAVNVGGTGKMPMADLRALCEDEGFTEFRSYVQSGNVIFCTERSMQAAKDLPTEKLGE